MPTKKVLAMKDEIDNDPEAIGYGGKTAVQILALLNDVVRDAPADTGLMLNYCVLNRSRTNNGTDTVPLPLLGRLEAVASAGIGVDIFGTTVAANEVDMEMKTWANAFLILFTSTTAVTIDFNNSEVSLGFDALGPGRGVVWKAPDIAALKAFSAGKQSRMSALRLGKARLGEVEEALALP